MRRIVFPLAVAALAPTAALAQWKASDGWQGAALAKLAPEALPKVETPAYYTALEAARELVARGRYKAALHALYVLPDAPEKALLKAEALLNLGDLDALRATLGDDASPRAAELRLRAALRTGVATPADLDAGRAALQAHAADWPLRHAFGRALEFAGDHAAARDVYRAAVDSSELKAWRSHGAEAFADAAVLTALAGCVDRHAVLTGGYAAEPRLHDEVLAMLTAAHDVVDRSFWPARLAVAGFLLARSAREEAGAELEAVLALNPNSVEAHRVAGEVAWQTFQFEACERAVAAIRAVDPAAREADVLLCHNLLAQRRYDAARVAADRLVARNGSDRQALGLLAACGAMAGDDALRASALARADALDADDAVALREVALQLAARRQYAAAVEHFGRAIARAPWWAELHTALGGVHGQSGDDDAARRAFETARLSDPFNREAVNYLRLLDDLAGYARVETPHFELVYDADADPAVAELMAEYLEEVHAPLAAKYAWVPDRRTRIEVYPTHDRFSVRISGSPFVGTVGACTGPLIALAAPRDGKETLGNFNWAEVLRHEYAHTVTLGASGNLIAHWMTEGLAVCEEERPIRFDWVAMLYTAANAEPGKPGALFDLDEVTWAFVRPEKPSDRGQAYAQSGWFCGWLIREQGQEKIVRLLHHFRAGKSQDEAFALVYAESPASVFDRFRAWAKTETARWGYGEDATKQYEALREEGDALVKGKRWPEAVEVWEEIARLRPMDALPHQRLAGLYLRPELKDEAKAAAHLAELDRGQDKDNRFAKRLARMALERNDLDAAWRHAVKATRIDSYDAAAHELAASVAGKRGDAKKAEQHARLAAVVKAMKANP